METDPVPGEGQHGVVVARPVDVDERAVHGGVQQGRVDAEPLGVGMRLLRQHDLGVHLLTTAPRSPQPLEHRPVGITPVTEFVVGAGHVDRLGAVRGPLGEPGGCLGGELGQHAVRVQRPRQVEFGRLVGPGVDAHHAPAGSVRALDHHLQGDAATLGQDQGRLERQFFQAVAAGLLPGVQGELDESGTGQKHAAENVVIGDPALRTPGQSAREHDTAGVRRGDGGAQQRMVDRRETGVGDSADLTADP